jgi:hypothetical protein
MNQTQREALIELAFLAIYSDSHISLKEEELLETAIAAQGWSSEYPKSLFVEKASALARAATDSEDSMKAFISERAAAFTSPVTQAAAYDILHQILSTDGIATTERAVLKRLNKAFPVPFI